MADCVEDENYDGYLANTIDPGPSFLIGTLFACVVLVSLLPFLVSYGRKRKAKRRERKVLRNANAATANGDAVHGNNDNNDDDSSSESDNDNKNNNRKRKGNNNNNTNNNNDDNESVSSSDSARTGISSVANTILNAILDSAPRGGPNMTKAKLEILHRDKQIQAEEAFENDMCEMSVGSTSMKQRERVRQHLRNNNSGISSDNHSIRSKDDGSVLGKLDHDAISIDDAIDSSQHQQQQQQQQQQRFNVNDTEAMAIIKNNYEYNMYKKKPPGSCCSMERVSYVFDRILVIAEWDAEAKRIVKLGLPFMIQSLLVGVSEAVRIAVIGRLLGTTILSAYIVVDLVVGVTTEFMIGFQDALITLCSQALGAENNILAGQYVQMVVILFTILYIPIFVVWYYSVKPIMLWFGLDEPTSDAGQDFAILLLLASLLHGLDESVHALLDCIGCENYSTVFTVTTQLFLTLGVYIEARSSTASLQGIGYAFVGVYGIALILNVIIVLWNGWVDPYLEGIIGSFSLRNGKGVRLLLSTTMSLSFGYLLTNGEWEILTFFAGALGTAEVAAWGILGALWEALEVVTTAIGNAAEVRVGYLLGAGRPREARSSAYKSLYFGMFATILVTSCLFMAGDNIPTWMTNDKTLQHMISELMPLFGIGNIALAIGSMSWTLVGAQGRYRLSTAVGFAGSWGVTIPLAATLTIALRFDLQGQTAAIVLGYMVSGTINSYLLITSNWESLSKRVIAYNTEHGIVESGSDDDDESSSSSSSSGSDDDDDDDDENDDDDKKSDKKIVKVDDDDDDSDSDDEEDDEKGDSTSRPDPMTIYNSKSNKSAISMK